jgi:hypothetical protein
MSKKPKLRLAGELSPEAQARQGNRIKKIAKSVRNH